VGVSYNLGQKQTCRERRLLAQSGRNRRPHGGPLPGKKAGRDLLHEAVGHPGARAVGKDKTRPRR
jgi:hypothetical protein